MPTKKHLDAYLDAMHRKDVAGTVDHMADNVVIHSPIAPAPFEGKQQVVEVLRGLLTNVDSFNMKQLIGDDEDYVAVFTIEVGPYRIDGMDHMHLNQDGLVDSMTVAWRPLPALVEVQKKLASAIGVAALTLVPLEDSLSSEKSS